jgi:hypothetical protein
VRVKSVVMVRVWVCMLLYCSQIHYRYMVAENQSLVLWGLGCAKKQKNLSVKTHYQDFLGVLIDLMVEFLVLIINNELKSSIK